MSDMIIGDYTAANSIDGSTNYLLIQPGNSSTAYKKINRNSLLGVTGQPMDISSSQNVTNKTLDNTNSITLSDANFTLQDDSDATKQAQFQLSGITTGMTRTYTLPDASSTLADIATAQTFTNKTLTSPTISGGTIDNATVTVDSIAGHTSSTSGTIYGLSISSGKIGSNGVVTASITDAAVTPAKLLAGTGSSWAWQSWTPTWGNLTVGNGTNGSRYTQIGKTVIAELKFTLGSTSSVGGSVTFTLPVSERSTYDTSYEMLGSGSLYHVASGAPWLVQAGWSSSGVGILYTWSISTSPVGRLLSASIPFTWASTDQIRVLLTYEAA